ncbi:MAG: hypothetical protein A2Y25_07535 [Candidatus Melainabacteria bacterium GWF2_37_15]|nr:MAG: hypothetical protein A2Y25_07535 [Candidatus Melainabacteria bacterium GWF2_37_15]
MKNDFFYIEKNNLYRQLKTNNSDAMQFSSNNYLGLAGDERLKEAVIEAVKKYGVGSTGSRLISGTHKLHVELEEKIAELKGTERALVFSTGYTANLGVLSAVLSEQDAVYSDQLNHASIIDGIKLSRANKFIYKHCDIADLEKLLSENHQKYRLNLIITDSIFSMDGDRAPLKEIVELKKKYNALLFVDEAHAFGIYGSNGQGLCHELGINKEVDIQMGTLSKAAGSEGGYIAGSRELIEFLINKSRSFIYSTAPSIPAIAASIKAVEIIKEGHHLRQKLYENINYLNSRLTPSQSPIFSIKFDTVEQTCRVSEQLLEKYNIQATAIRPPTVETPRIRISTTALHTRKELDYLIKSLKSLSFNFVR